MFSSGIASHHVDLLDRLNTFLTAKGSAFGLTYTGTGNGALTAYSGGPSSVAETFTITATSPTSFDVTGSVTGSIGPATVGSPFVHANLEFLLTAGATPFTAGDTFTLSTAPPWVGFRKSLGARVTATQANTGQWAAQNLVDGKNETGGSYWRVDSPVTIPQNVEFALFQAETITSYQMAAFDASHMYMPRAWHFQYWDGVSWQTLDTRTGISNWTTNDVKTFTIASPVSATRYRLRITDIQYTLVILGAVRLLRADGIDAAFSQTIWQAPGNDGNSEIFCGARAFERLDTDYFNWELAAFDGHQASFLWRQQAGHHGRLYVPLWNEAIPYWMVANGRRAIVVAKVHNQYEVAYLGLLDPYFSPGQWPYPIALGGSLAFGTALPAWNSTSWRWTNVTTQHAAFTHSDPGTTASVAIERYQMRARNWDGSWMGFESAVNGLFNTAPGAGRAQIWPYRCGLTLLDRNIDQSFTLWPVMLNTAAPNTIGQLSGVACVTGQGATAETLIRLGAVDWIVLPNINRIERGDFFAVALD